MKARVYLRIGYDSRRRKSTVAVNVRPSHAPLLTSGANPLPTVAFAVDFTIPDEVFRRAEQVIAEITIPEEALAIAAEVKQ